jgi:hypothetical protein
MLLKFTVKTNVLKEVLRRFNPFTKKGYPVFMDFRNDGVKLWVRNRKTDDILENKIYYESLEVNKPISWVALDKEQLKLFKQAIRHYKNELITIELKENDNYLIRIPRQLRFKLVVNGYEMEIS